MHNPSSGLTACFEDILDCCVVSLGAGERTVEECLTCYPDWRDDLEPLLRLAVRLQAAHTFKPSPAFRAMSAIRMRNLIAAHPRQVAWPASRPGAQWRLSRTKAFYLRLAIAVVTGAALVVSLLVGAGAVLAADALPGEALYPVKMAIEAAQLILSPSGAGDARLHMVFAARRLEEAADLVEGNRPEGIKQALAGYDAHLEWVFARLGEDSAWPAKSQERLARMMVKDLSDHEAQFAVLLDRVPESGRLAVESAQAASRAGRDRALAVLADKGPLSEELDRGEGLPALSPTVPGDLPGAGSLTPTSMTPTSMTPTALTPTALTPTGVPTVTLFPVPTYTLSPGDMNRVILTLPATTPLPTITPLPTPALSTATPLPTPGGVNWTPIACTLTPTAHPTVTVPPMPTITVLPLPTVVVPPLPTIKVPLLPTIKVPAVPTIKVPAVPTVTVRVPKVPTWP